MAPQRSINFLLGNALEIAFSNPINDVKFFSKSYLFPDLWIFSFTENVNTQFITRPKILMLIHPYKQVHT